MRPSRWRGVRALTCTECRFHRLIHHRYATDRSATRGGLEPGARGEVQIEMFREQHERVFGRSNRRARENFAAAPVRELAIANGHTRAIAPGAPGDELGFKM